MVATKAVLNLAERVEFLHGKYLEYYERGRARCAEVALDAWEQAKRELEADDAAFENARWQADRDAERRNEGWFEERGGYRGEADDDIERQAEADLEDRLARQRDNAIERQLTYQEMSAFHYADSDLF